MSDSPPTTAASAPDGGPYLLQVVADVSDLKARLSIVEHRVPEVATRLEGRLTSVEGQIARTQDHLAQQDQQQATFRLDMKSTLGTLASGLSLLQQAEQHRATEAHEAAERAAEAQQRATEQAAENRAETRRWAMQTLASAILVVPSIVWPLIVTHPLLWRLGVPAACVALVLVLAALAWLRSR